MKDKAAQRRHIPPTRNPVSVESSSEAPGASGSVVVDEQEPLTDKTAPAAPEPAAPSPPQHAGQRPLRVTRVPKDIPPVERGDLYRSTTDRRSTSTKPRTPSWKTCGGLHGALSRRSTLPAAQWFGWPSSASWPS